MLAPESERSLKLGKLPFKISMLVLCLRRWKAAIQVNLWSAVRWFGRRWNPQEIPSSSFVISETWDARLLKLDAPSLVFLETGQKRHQWKVCNSVRHLLKRLFSLENQSMQRMQGSEKQNIRCSGLLDFACDKNKDVWTVCRMVSQVFSFRIACAPSCWVKSMTESFSQTGLHPQNLLKPVIKSCNQCHFGETPPSIAMDTGFVVTSATAQATCILLWCMI